jgi:alpha-beta hydrolase superfamily lysophospholipase
MSASPQAARHDLLRHSSVVTRLVSIILMRLPNHGIAEDGGRYPHAVRKLVDAGYVVYALDARGHGRSQGKRGSVNRFDHLVADLHAFVERVVRPTSLIPVFLLGYSLGGAVTVAYALEHQDGLAGAVVIGSALGRGSGVSRLAFATASLLSLLAPGCPLIKIRASDTTSDPEVACAYDADPLVHHRRVNARTIGELTRVIRCLPNEFHRLKLPLLLLHGAADVTASPEGSAGLYEGAGSADKTIKQYNACRHDLLNEPGHDSVIADIVDWLDAHR